MSKSKKRSRGYSSQSFTRNAVSCLFAFLLSLMLTLIGLILVLQAATTRWFVDRSFDSDYSAFLTSYINDAAYDYTLPASIDPAVLDGVFTEDQAAKDMRQAVAAAFAGVRFIPDTDAMRAQLAANVEASFEGTRLALNPNAQQIIDAYVDDIMEIYENSFNIYGLSVVTEMSSRYGMYAWIVLAVAVVFAVILWILCVKLHRWAHRGLRYVAYAAGGACLMSVAAPLYAYISRFYERIQVTPQYVYYYITRYVAHILEAFILVAAVWLVLMIVIILIISVKRKKAVRGY